MVKDRLIEQLNAPARQHRLDALRALQAGIESGELPRPKKGIDINSHIHTTYSFSPYSPTKAVWMAYQAGLQTAGIIDHDSISGAEEFIEAGKIVGIATTVGFEARASYAKTHLAHSRFNNPDQKGNAYLLVHGVPHQMIHRADEFLRPVREVRLKRLRAMGGRIGELVKPFGVDYDFDRDSLPYSNAKEGGGTTERHLLFGFAHVLIKHFGQGGALLAFLTDKLGIPVSEKIAALLLDTENPYYAYDLLGALKSDMVEKIYINATDEECAPPHEILAFANEIGAICCYSYLGDVGDSVTGDKKTQTFEDAILDELLAFHHELGFRAITYAPTRNTLKQLTRLRTECEKYGFLQLSGEDINQPRQAFICEVLRRDDFKHLIDATWALIGHEKAATRDINDGFFAHNAVTKYPGLTERIAAYAKIGREE